MLKIYKNMLNDVKRFCINFCLIVINHLHIRKSANLHIPQTLTSQKCCYF